ncbi:MAG: alpha-mannosidase [bacterium]|nr:alpha-mannosidase [bacterium]
MTNRRVALGQRELDADLFALSAAIAPSERPLLARYRTRTGAVLQLDGVTVGAFDREHDELVLPPSARERHLTLLVERFALPASGLPSGDGLRWRWMNARGHERPSLVLELVAFDEAPLPAASGALTLWGHAHLDVAWLWPYSHARRKAQRTFANALALMERDPSYRFMQSQPQLFAFVESEDPALFERVRARVAEGRFDPSVAAMWVEPDANVPSGESLLRQMLFARRYCVERFGTEPSIAWLPDTFGFARTLPTLLAHAGITRFATTKLMWNDTTRFPHAQFRWRGPDGSEVLAALLASYEGDPSARRAALARERDEPLVIGFGDGGGGPTYAQAHASRAVGAWSSPSAWFDRLDERRASLPVHDDELYLEYHRGTYTTHHDIKARNAALERSLALAEERLAWCIAVRAQPETLARLREALDGAWERVLCNQFHDVLPGTAVPEAFAQAHELYDEADDAVRRALDASSAMLPRGRAVADAAPVAPRRDGDAYVFDNGIVRACVDERGSVHELMADGAANAVARANVLVAYRDRPRAWDAWNLDAGYERRRVRVVPQDHAIVDGALECRMLVGASPLVMRIALAPNEPFLRVTCAVDWRESHTLLRVEHWLAVESDRVRYGAPHGTVERGARRDTPAERARFEVPGQRYALVADERRGFAAFALDTYGWSARVLRGGGLHLGHSLLRSPTWPDPGADRGTVELTWALVPCGAAPISAIERAWETFAHEPRVRLFTGSDRAVLVVACKPASDGDGVIVRVRECDGADREVRLRCGARMRSVEAVDGLERPLPALPARIEGEELVATLPARGLRSFRVRFS